MESDRKCLLETFDVLKGFVALFFSRPTGRRSGRLHLTHLSAAPGGPAESCSVFVREGGKSGKEEETTVRKPGTISGCVYFHRGVRSGSYTSCLGCFNQKNPSVLFLGSSAENGRVRVELLV